MNPLTRPRPDEIPALTSSRGYFAIWVVIFHYWSELVILFPAAGRASGLLHCAEFAVPAFFVLSGFVLSYNYADRFRVLSAAQTCRYLGLRLARVYPVHLFTLLALAALAWGSALVGISLDGANYTGQDFALNLLLVHTWVPNFTLSWNYPSWSISSEWFAYLIFPFAVAWGLRRLSTPSRAGAFGALALVASVGVMVYGQAWPFFKLILVVPTFFTGVAMEQFLRWQPPASRPGYRWLPELLTLAIPVACFIPATGLMTPYFSLFTGLIAALAWARNVAHGWWTCRGGVFLGELSYSLYMTHVLAQKLGNKLLPAERYAGATPVLRVGLLVAYAAIVAITCLLTYYLVEKPCREYFRKRGRQAREESRLPARALPALAEA